MTDAIAERKKVVGVDLSLNATGIVLIDEMSKVADCRTFGYSLTKTATVGLKAERINQITDIVVEFVKRNRVRHVAVEKATFGSIFRSLELSGLTAVLENKLHVQCGIVPVYMTISPIRKYHLGVNVNGKGIKRIVMDHFKNKGYVLSNDNEYDALAIGLVLWDNLNMRDSFQDKDEGLMKSLDKYMKANGV